MNTIKAFITLISFSIVAVSCNKHEKHSDEEIVNVSSNSSTQENSDLKEIAFNDASVSTIWSDYLNLKTALVNSSSLEVKEAANLMISNLEQIQTEDIKAIALKMSLTDDLDEQRLLFSELTSQIETVFSSSISDGQIYKQFCPMAFNNEGGYWLSDSDAIRNPYFGNKMLKCGKVSETIKN